MLTRSRMTFWTSVVVVGWMALSLAEAAQVISAGGASAKVGGGFGVGSASRERVVSAVLHGSVQEDPMEALSAAELEKEWMGGMERSMSSLRGGVGEFSHQLTVEVRLVGFEGLSLRSLQATFDALPHAHPVFGLDGHRLNASAEVLYSVSRAPKQLLSALDALRKLLLESSERRVSSHEGTELLLIDPAPLHRLLADDHSSRGALGPVFYVLDEAPQESDYPLFAYLSQGSLDPSGRLLECPSQGRAGGQEGASETPVAWLDLASGPLRYGPATSGAGTVTHITFPSAFDEYLHSREEGGEDHRVERNEFQMALAGLVEKSVAQLLAPPVFRAAPESPSMQPWERLLFKLVWVREVPHILDDATTSPYAEHMLFDGASPADALLLSQLAHFPGKGLELELQEPAHRLDGHWPLQLAWSSALMGAYASSGRHEQMVDSAVLHAHLQRWWAAQQAQLRNLPSRKQVWNPSPSHRVVPLFVFDMPLSPFVQFEDRQSSRVFDDMAVVLRSQGRHPSRDSCEGVALSFEASNVSRPLLAAMLSTGWNMAPHEAFWDRAHSQVAHDYLWANNPGPFSSLSEQISLSYFHGYVAQRNLLYSHVTHIQNRILQHLDPLIRSGFHLHQLLPRVAYQLLIRRWNMLELKLSQASSHLSLGKFLNAFRFLQSCEHDIVLLQPLLLQARSNLRSSLDCRVDDLPPSSPTAHLADYTDYIFGPIFTFLLFFFLLLRVGARNPHTKCD